MGRRSCTARRWRIAPPGALLLAAGAVLLLLAPLGASPAPGEAHPRVESAAGILIDGRTGAILWAKDAHEPRPPASLTKIVTALVVLDRIALEEPVSISAAAAAMNGSRFGLRSGEQGAAWKLLYGLLLSSGNDAAVALAEHAAPSQEVFAAWMTEKAQRLGALNTRFANAHGLHHGEQHTTAYDVAVITRAALQNRTFAGIVGTNQQSLDWNGEPRAVTNINSLLWRYAGATGVKTGYTRPAGYCLAAAARRGEHELILVLLGAPSSEARWRDAAHVLDYGFTHRERLLRAPEVDATVYTVRRGDSLWAVARRFGTTVQAIVQRNRLANPDRIYPGQQLIIPEPHAAL